MHTIFLHGMTLIDGTGAEPLENASLLAENGVIRRIETAGAPAPQGAETVDLTGTYVVPGIIDCHIHAGLDAAPGCLQRAAEATAAETAVTYLCNLQKLLSDGVVYFREMGCKHHADIAAARAVREGRFIGPDVLPGGDLLTITGGHCWGIGRECDGPAELVKAVRDQFKAGARSLKLMGTGGIHTPGNRTDAPQLNRDELCAAVREAHKFGMVTGSHCFGAQSAHWLLDAGIDSIEHGCFLCDDESVFDRMLAQGTVYVPTIHAIRVIADDDPALGLSAELLSKSVPAHKKHVESFRMALEKGVKLAFGTDRGTTYNYHETGSIELVAMRQYGMPPMEIIRSFSRNAAELLRIDGQYGTLEPGKRANFLVVDRDPLADIGVLAGEKQVYLGGVRRI